MGNLKQSVVIVNEYTIRGSDGGGSRGGSPGKYVLRYMARKAAVEDTTPVRFDMEPYILRYMSRDTATEHLSGESEILHTLDMLHGYGGIAFGNGDVSLSHKKLERLSADIQSEFDKGKTVLKTVVSFDQDYLREAGCISPDFVCRKRGDYRGNLDQMKLRLGIMAGMERLSKHYDRLSYVGVIQVDTMHVHCHLAMVDKGRGQVMPDGTQKGKLTERMKEDFRHGLDLKLMEYSKVRQMSSNVAMDGRNARLFVKRHVHQAVEERGFAQLMFTVLPEDRKLWRAGSNRKEMQRGNALVREYVEGVLAQPDSGYREALSDIQAYASERVRREGLSTKRYRQFIRQGKERLVLDCMDGVYSVLKETDPDSLKTRTPMLDAFGLDYEILKDASLSDPILEFSYRMRTYQSRKEFHQKEAAKYRQAVRGYEATQDVSSPSAVMLTFFKQEQEYQEKLLSKYQYFLDFVPLSDTYKEEYEQLKAERLKWENYQKFLDDRQVDVMSERQLEDYGQNAYGFSGGGFYATARDVLFRRMDQAKDLYLSHRETFQEKLGDDGLVLDDHGIRRESRHPFSEVRALDLHHLAYDFEESFPLSRVCKLQFLAAAERRYQTFEDARKYLIQTGQESQLKQFPVRDIGAMKALMDTYRQSDTFVSQRKNLAVKPYAATISLDLPVERDLQKEVQVQLSELTKGMGE